MNGVFMIVPASCIEVPRFFGANTLTRIDAILRPCCWFASEMQIVYLLLELARSSAYEEVVFNFDRSEVTFVAGVDADSPGSMPFPPDKRRLRDWIELLHENWSLARDQSHTDCCMLRTYHPGTLTTWSVVNYEQSVQFKKYQVEVEFIWNRSIYDYLVQAVVNLATLRPQHVFGPDVYIKSLSTEILSLANQETNVQLKSEVEHAVQSEGMAGIILQEVTRQTIAVHPALLSFCKGA